MITSGLIGAAAAGLVAIIAALFKRNQNSKDRMDYEIELIKVVNTQNQVSKDIVYQLGELNGTVKEIQGQMRDFNQRLLVLEKETELKS